ncbi:hypothetical protein [Xanthocytophaga agilis]|uniref:Uncharacterized protein n=1 Tax=Xanthocytophaga agilis TaxID=3048010 RepID=A0AAE3UI48_9BACT|nr:hypothetical protein [Xanthocytophaga agilis]MDJ1506130.1 hypothetical protein [Xanthocytophaga agilis]
MMMKAKQIISILAGFGAIGLLSSLAAHIQGIIYPESVKLFDHIVVSKANSIQLLIKLSCVSTSCFMGGILVAWLGGNKNAATITGISIVMVVAWLWIHTIYPIWFWTLLLTIVIPIVRLGYHFIHKQTFG